MQNSSTGTLWCVYSFVGCLFFICRILAFIDNILNNCYKYDVLLTIRMKNLQSLESLDRILMYNWADDCKFEEVQTVFLVGY